ncbi:hypothetical protein DITRI_Ditri20bG0108000 [Diplodiscus trichospermus]
MDNKTPDKEVAEEVTRESLIAISYPVPDKGVASKLSSENLNGEKLVEGIDSNGAEKYRSALISISYTPSPDELLSFCVCGVVIYTDETAYVSVKLDYLPNKPRIDFAVNACFLLKMYLPHQFNVRMIAVQVWSASGLEPPVMIPGPGEAWDLNRSGPVLVRLRPSS